MSIAEIYRSSANIFVNALSLVKRKTIRNLHRSTFVVLRRTGVYFLTVQFMGRKMMDDIKENSLLSYVLHFF